MKNAIKYRDEKKEELKAEGHIFCDSISDYNSANSRTLPVLGLYLENYKNVLRWRYHRKNPVEYKAFSFWQSRDIFGSFKRALEFANKYNDEVHDVDLMFFEYLKFYRNNPKLRYYLEELQPKEIIQTTNFLL